MGIFVYRPPITQKTPICKVAEADFHSPFSRGFQQIKAKFLDLS